MTNLELLKKLISFDSQSQKTNKEIVEFIADLFPKESVTIIPLNKGKLDIYNLIVKFEGESNEKPLIFSGHTDTVPETEKWTKDPFNAQLENGKLYGLGSSDMKAGLAAFIQAMLSFKDKEKPRQDIYLLFDCDEEVTGIGGKDFLNNLNIKEGSANVVVAEPSDMELQIGQKGVMEVFVEFTGKACHSSKTNYENNIKNNAIYKASDLIQKLKEYEKKLVLEKDELYGEPTLSVNTINGGTMPNIIADSCKLTINRRLTPLEDKDEAFKEIEKIILEVDKNAKIEIGFYGDSNVVDKESELWKVVEEISEKELGFVKKTVFTGWTQAGLFKKWGNCLIWGPGTLDMAHKADEYCEIEQVDKIVECYKELIRKMAY